MEVIPSINISADGQIICIGSKAGVSMYETTRFCHLVTINSFPRDLKGEISNSKLFYNTRILSFILKEKIYDSKDKKIFKYSPNEILVIVDVAYNRTLGKILIKDKIDDYEITQNFIIIKLKKHHKILLFITKTLEYFHTIENVNLGTIQYNENYDLTTDQKFKFISINNMQSNDDSSNNSNTNYSDTNSKNSKNIENQIINNNENINNDPNSNGISEKNDEKQEKDIINNMNNTNINNIKDEEKKENNDFEIIANSNIHHCMFAYQNFKDKKKVIILEYLLDKNRKNILQYREKTFVPEFYSAGVKFIYLIESYLLISSNIGNKLHIYNINDFSLLYCIFLGDFPYNLSGISLNNDKKIISIITNNKYVKLFKFNKIYKTCNCKSHDDEKVSFCKKRSILAKIKHKINSGKTPVLCKYKINLTLFEQQDNDSIIVFDKKNKDIVWVVQKNCVLTKLFFDPSRAGKMTLMKAVELSEFYRFEIEEEVKIKHSQSVK